MKQTQVFGRRGFVHKSTASGNYKRVTTLSSIFEAGFLSDGLNSAPTIEIGCDKNSAEKF
jgi:hypothetical protein